jgi:hypothetical protein
MESLLFAGPFVFGTLAGATVRLSKVRSLRAADEQQASADTIFWGWLLAAVGLALSAVGILLQSDVAGRGATTKASETVAVECLKDAFKKGADPATTCERQRSAWENDAGEGAGIDGFRALLAALGTTLLGLGFGDLIVKPLAKT